MAATTRAAAATSLAGLCFLGGGEMAEVSFSSIYRQYLVPNGAKRSLYIIRILQVVSTMQILEGVFSGSYSKKDGTIPAPSADLQALHCAALSSWSLLLTLLTSGDVFRLATTQVFTIPISWGLLIARAKSPGLLAERLTPLHGRRPAYHGWRESRSSPRVCLRL